VDIVERLMDGGDKERKTLLHASEKEDKCHE
jgi:hypothetical protein